MTPTAQILWSALLTRIARRDESAMSEFYRLTRPALAAKIRRMIHDPSRVEEVLQDVYWHVWQNAARYQPERGTPGAWLQIVTRCRTFDHLRTTRRDFQQCEWTDRDSPTANLEEEVVAAHRLRVVRRALHRLPEGQRNLVEMAFVEGYSHSEIARKLDTPLGTVKTRIRTALLLLRETLAGQELD